MRLSYFQVFVLAGAVAFTCLTSNVEAGKEPAIKAAYELFDTLDLPNTYKQTIVQLVDMQMQQSPQIAPFRQVMLDFFEKYMGWDSIKEDMAKLYAEKFTTDEMNKLKQFYLTPLGKKARLLPELTAVGAGIGQRRVQENMGELQKMMAKKAQELKPQPQAQPQ